MARKITTFAPKTAQEILKAKNQVLHTGRPQGSPAAGRLREVPWYWGVVKGKVKSDGTFSTSFTGGSFTAAEWLAVELWMMRGAGLQQNATGAITGFGGGGGSATLCTFTGTGPREGQPIIITGTTSGALDGIWYAVNVTSNTFTLQGTVAKSGGVNDGDPVMIAVSSGGGSWTSGVPVANRSPTLSGTAPVGCKIEFGHGEWSQKWIDC